MNPLKCYYLALLVLLCLGFSFGHRILQDTKNNDPFEEQNQTHENKAMEQTHDVGYGYGSGSNGGTGIGIGMGGGGSNQKCQGEPCQQQQPCQGEPCQGQGGVNVPGIRIPGIEIPPISIPIPVPQFPVPAQPTHCPPQNCRTDPCPPVNCNPGSCQQCSPYNYQDELKKNDDGQTEMKKHDGKNHEVEAKMTHHNTDDSVHDSKTQSIMLDEEARHAQVHH